MTGIQKVAPDKHVFSSLIYFVERGGRVLAYMGRTYATVCCTEKVNALLIVI